MKPLRKESKLIRKTPMSEASANPGLGHIRRSRAVPRSQLLVVEDDGAFLKLIAWSAGGKCYGWNMNDGIVEDCGVYDADESAPMGDAS